MSRKPGEKVQVNIPEPTFTVIKATCEGLPEVIVANNTLKDFPDKDVFGWCLQITIVLQELAEQGMPTPDESARAFEIGDRIETAVLQGKNEFGAQNGLFVSRSTWNGQRELIYQVNDPEVAHADLQSLLHAQDWSLDWDYRMDHDADWTASMKVLSLLSAPDVN